LKQKQLAEEEEGKESVKARRILAYFSLKLPDSLQKISENDSSDNMFQVVHKNK
jgi:hypothetical protein